MISYAIEIVLFIASTGVFFNERFRQNRLAVGMAGIIAISSVYYLGKAVWSDLGYMSSREEQPNANQQSPAPQSLSPPQPSIQIQQPRFKLTSPEAAITPNVIFPTVGFGTGGYALTNTGWDAPSITDIDVSLWALLPSGLTKIDSRKISYLPKNGVASANGIKKPFPSGKFILCISYSYDSHRVEAMHYYTNEPDPSFPTQITLREFRNPKSEIDGSNSLCNSLPNSVGQLPLPPARQPQANACITVNAKQVCQ